MGGDNRLVDIELASDGSLPSDPMLCLARWDEIRALNNSAVVNSDAPVATLERLDCPVPRPRQLFAVGLNYRKHAEEMGSPLPGSPLSEPEAWNHVAGLCAGQDISDRQLQNSGRPPQFSLGKSRQGFAPIGPWVCDLRDNPKRDELMIGCTVNGEVRQQTSVNDMSFDIAQLVSYLSTVCELFPGDIIYTGTPSGVGHGRKPPVYLRPGDIIETSLELVGTLRNLCV